MSVWLLENWSKIGPSNVLFQLRGMFCSRQYTVVAFIAARLTDAITVDSYVDMNRLMDENVHLTTHLHNMTNKAETGSLNMRDIKQLCN
jgi:hypothetical protein